MNKKILTKRIMAGVLYFGGIVFALYISLMIIKGNTIFDALALIISMLGVCIPIIIATFLLISSIQKVEKRFRVMSVFVSIVLVFYIMLLVAVLFRNGFRRFEAISTIGIKEHLKWRANFIPLKTIGGYIRFFINDSINKSIIIENLLGNILLFAPMGMLLPCMFQNLRKFKMFLTTMLVILVSVEIGQLLTSSGSCDIDDVILNLIGAILFYGLWSLDVIQKMLSKFYVLKEEKLK